MGFEERIVCSFSKAALENKDGLQISCRRTVNVAVFRPTEDNIGSRVESRIAHRSTKNGQNPANQIRRLFLRPFLWVYKREWVERWPQLDSQWRNLSSIDP